MLMKYICFLSIPCILTIHATQAIKLMMTYRIFLPSPSRNLGIHAKDAIYATKMYVFSSSNLCDQATHTVDAAEVYPFFLSPATLWLTKHMSIPILGHTLFFLDPCDSFRQCTGLKYISYRHHLEIQCLPIRMWFLSFQHFLPPPPTMSLFTQRMGLTLLIKQVFFSFSPENTSIHTIVCGLRGAVVSVVAF